MKLVCLKIFLGFTSWDEPRKAKGFRRNFSRSKALLRRGFAGGAGIAKTGTGFGTGETTTTGLRTGAGIETNGLLGGARTGERCELGAQASNGLDTGARDTGTSATGSGLGRDQGKLRARGTVVGLGLRRTPRIAVLLNVFNSDRLGALPLVALFNPTTKDFTRPLSGTW